MKTFSIFLILILTLAFAVAANAEETAFGIKAGVSFASIVGDDTDDLKSLTGFMGGGFVAFPLSPTISIQPEVFYAQKGAKYDDGGTDGSIKLDYIDIPVLFKYTMAGESARPYFLFGPAVGFRVSSKLSEGDESVDIDEFISSTNFGLVFGLGVNFQKFLLEVRYDVGLSNIWDFENIDSITNKNSVFGIMVGYNF